jgi:AraC family transcriptional regulator of adaptative response/methylated-DNA-[protein]-cysteine methyltransferase
MEKVIHYLNEHHTEQPSLDELARLAGLSPCHFQRKFTDWVGVSPKSLLQHLTFTNARARLRTGESVEQAAWGAGLSSPSRLYDLSVMLEGASPGDIKRGGAGLRIEYGFSATPFGRCLIGLAERGITYLAFVDRGDPAALSDLRRQWPRAEFIAHDRNARRVIDRIFRRDAGLRQPLRAYVQGTKFQLRVWRALLQVDPGQVVTYGALAKAVGRPTAVRAVGTAVGANPLAYLIPCHRVIRASGAVGGYRWGSGRKQIMLASEIASIQL